MPKGLTAAFPAFQQSDSGRSQHVCGGDVHTDVAPSFVYTSCQSPITRCFNSESPQLVPYVNTWRNTTPASAVPGHRQVYPHCRVGPHTVAWPTGGLTRCMTPTVPHSRHGGGGFSPYRLMLRQTTVQESPYPLLFALPRLGRPGSLRPLRLTSVGEISGVPPDWTHTSLRLH